MEYSILAEPRENEVPLILIQRRMIFPYAWVYVKIAKLQYHVPRENKNRKQLSYTITIQV